MPAGISLGCGGSCIRYGGGGGGAWLGACGANGFLCISVGDLSEGNMDDRREDQDFVKPGRFFGDFEALPTGSS
jgi:hypothetical protein